MRKNKKIGIIFFSFIFLLASSWLVFNGTTYNSESSCGCHSVTGALSVNSVNGTTLNVAKGTNFTIAFYASTTLTGGYTFVARFLIAPTGTLNCSPQMEPGGTGIYDGASGDPDGIENDEIGNVTNPVLVEVFDVPDSDVSFIITIVAADAVLGVSKDKATLNVLINVGAGGELPLTPWEWFLDTQIPIIIIIGIIFSAGIVASIVLRAKMDKN